jgi:hypothetical protein
VAASLVALALWKWTPIVAVLLSLFILGGAIVAGGVFDHLTGTDGIDWFVGTWVQMLGLITALVAGALTTLENYQARPLARSR